MLLFWLIVSMPAVCGGLVSEGTPTTWGFRASRWRAGSGRDVQRSVGFGKRALQDDGAGATARMSQDVAAVENS